VAGSAKSIPKIANLVLGLPQKFVKQKVIFFVERLLMQLNGPMSINGAKLRVCRKISTSMLRKLKKFA
jgi:hypothetical protein